MAKYSNVTAGQTEACINRMGGWSNFLRFIGGEGKVVFETILTLVRTVLIPAQPAVTTSEKYFEEAGVVRMGDDFKAQSLDLEVGATEEVELAVRKLKCASLNAPILTELGNKAELTVSQFRAFLAANRGSFEWFVSYLKGKDGNLWAVHARRHVDGWSVYARSVESPYEWHASNHIVSRN
ncbi:MAG: hypothetical protein A2665_00355 [Candidatus Zambryskibacteria bacterium RIFCSPHIGHO2_01_FULL_46_30]|uniref:Uncharacterized protein n=1 Tax=Candidatus Zambryskibacteria bacterium RIFCSPHIGHO2_01_FULL_46_30 TaxID=1802739 RepID=A0A1G2T588_9BACT|nr:MAG: hypothetical protein A2665_00355 [Candidatus Zambryskibacteria bacterium RIFCSPHIGHO2_01_FULL_46_30]OHB05959.1 MAG: hypothetical protein A3B22_01120 [Candidatus Zambryskibacteria bacterium RIFCSPLOWO2_01_FULL_47_33]